MSHGGVKSRLKLSVEESAFRKERRRTLMLIKTSSLPTIAVSSARVDSLIMTETADEVLVYDQLSHQIHHLNHASAVIWRLCDGRQSIADLSRLASAELGSVVSEDAVRLALGKLEDAKLLSAPLVDGMRMAGQTRRSFLRKAALAGAVPVVVSVTAPTAARAATVGCFEDCNNNNSACNDGQCPQCGPGSGSGSGTVCCHNSQPPFLCD
jgi:hypothetical protein